MPQIIQRIQLKASPADVFVALTKEPWLRGWWARGTIAGTEIGSITELRSGDGKLAAKMRIEQLEAPSRVAWRCVEGPAEWMGTRVAFEIAAQDDGSALRLIHDDWSEASDAMAECNVKWAILLHNLKALLETPEPNDVFVSQYPPHA